MGGDSEGVDRLSERCDDTSGDEPVITGTGGDCEGGGGDGELRVALVRVAARTASNAPARSGAVPASAAAAAAGSLRLTTRASSGVSSMLSLATAPATHRRRVDPGFEAHLRAKYTAGTWAKAACPTTHMTKILKVFAVPRS